MIKRLYIIIFIASPFLNYSYAQQQVKPDLYLYFEADSSGKSYKFNKKIPAYIRKDKNINRPAQDFDVYGYQYISSDGTKEYNAKLFATIDKNKYSIKDSVFVRKYTRPYKTLNTIKGIFNDVSDQNRFPFKRVFIVEKIAVNQYKAVQVQSYIGSDEVYIKQLRK